MNQPAKVTTRRQVAEKFLRGELLSGGAIAELATINMNLFEAVAFLRLVHVHQSVDKAEGELIILHAWHYLWETYKDNGGLPPAVSDAVTHLQDCLILLRKV